MADDDIYDIMPHKEIAVLKKELQQLKTDKKQSPEVVKSMTTLSQSMDSMLRLFTEAAEELKLEGKEEQELKDHLGPIHDKLDQVLEQNRTIAEGMVALSDMIKDYMQHHKDIPKIEPIKAPPQQFNAPPAFDQDPFADIPQPDMGQAPPGAPPSSAPMPPSSESKRGIFGRLKK